jgi:hypothetical protein
MIVVNLEKARVIAHEKRRVARDKEMAPWDDIISKQIPGSDLENAVVERQKIRIKYQDLQELMDAAATVEELKELLP